MPLVTLQLAENNISVAQAVELVGALRAGAPHLKELDLSGNPVCGVEEGGKDEFSTELVEALCAWLQEQGQAQAQAQEQAQAQAQGQAQAQAQEQGQAQVQAQGQGPRRAEGPGLTSLSLVDVALCGQVRVRVRVKG